MEGGDLNSYGSWFSFVFSPLCSPPSWYFLSWFAVLRLHFFLLLAFCTVTGSRTANWMMLKHLLNGSAQKWLHLLQHLSYVPLNSTRVITSCFLFWNLEKLAAPWHCLGTFHVHSLSLASRYVLNPLYQILFGISTASTLIPWYS